MLKRNLLANNYEMGCLRRCRQKVVKEEEGEVKMPHLDKDVMTNIFSKIPVEILDKKFRHQCKEWFNLLSFSTPSDPNMNRSKDGIIFIDDESDDLKMLGFMEMEGSELKIRELNTLKTDLVLISSCNGLVLARKRELVHGHFPIIFVLNPSTMESIEIPSCEGEHRCVCEWHELIYDSSSTKFKVVDMFYSDSIDAYAFHVRNLDDCRNHLYYTSDVLRDIEVPSNSCLEDATAYWNERTFVDGILYVNLGSRCKILSSFGLPYVNRGPRCKIISFDVRNGTICLMKSPIPENNVSFGKVKLTKLGETLTLVDCVKNGKFPWDVWCLKDVNTREWEMKFRIEAIPKDIYSKSVVYWYEVVGSLNNGEVLVFSSYRYRFSKKKRYNEIFLYEVKTRQWRVNSLRGEGSSFHCCRSVHVNNLASIK